MDCETKHALRRASEEALKAISSEGPAEAVHEALSVQYSAKAVGLLVQEDEAAKA